MGHICMSTLNVYIYKKGRAEVEAVKKRYTALLDSLSFPQPIKLENKS